MSNATEIQTVTNETYVVDGKNYKTLEAAEAAQAALANVDRGYQFVSSQHPELGQRGARTKANLIGAYLDWVDAGEPELSEDEVSERIQKAAAKAGKASE